MTDLLRPTFSVVVPLYNKEAYIGRCLNSILGQTFEDFEVIVVDDGSTDRSFERAGAIQDKRLRLIAQPNGGPGAARNRGIAEARADLVAFLDADDEWLPDFLAAVKRLNTAFPEAGLLATGYRRILDTGNVREVTLTAPNQPIHLIYNYFQLSRTSEFVTCSSVAIRKQALVEIGGFLERAKFGEDLDLWARISSKHPIGFDSQILAVYHTEADGRSFQLSGKLPPRPVIVERLRSLAKSPDVAPEVAREILIFADHRLIKHAYWLVSLRHRAALLEFLQTERFHTRRYQMEARVLLALLMVAPMRLIEAVKVRSDRLLKARWIDSLNSSARDQNAAVSVRLVRSER